MLFMLTHMFLVQVNTIKVSNLSLGASERDIKEFFSFSGDIAYVEMMRFDTLFSLMLCFVDSLLFFFFFS